jgi:hypothetical protein
MPRAISDAWLLSQGPEDDENDDWIDDDDEDDDEEEDFAGEGA